MGILHLLQVLEGLHTFVENTDLCPGLPKHPSCRIPGLPPSFSTATRLNWNLWEKEGSCGELEVCRESRAHLIPPELWFLSSSTQIHQRARSWHPEQRDPGLAGLCRLLLEAQPCLQLGAGKDGHGAGRRLLRPAGFSQQLQWPPAPRGVPRCPHSPEQTPKLGATIPRIPAFGGAHLPPLRANVFFCPSFADPEGRSSGEQEESGATLAQEMAKEMVGTRTLHSPQVGSKGLLPEQAFNASSGHFSKLYLLCTKTRWPKANLHHRASANVL